MLPQLEVEPMHLEELMPMVCKFANVLMKVTTHNSIIHIDLILEFCFLYIMAYS